MKEKKISPYQAAALMLCFSLARLAAFRPEGDDLLVCAGAEIVSGGVLLAAAGVISYLPAPESKMLRRIGAAAAGAYLMLMLTVLLCGLAGSLQYSFPDFYSPTVIIAAAAAAAAYCASMGFAGCARAACAAVVLTLFVFVLLSAGAAGRFEVNRLDLAVADKGIQLLRRTVSSVGYSAELPLVTLILRENVEAPRRAGVIWFAGRSVSFAAMLTVCKGILGDHSVTGIPIDTLSSYSKTTVIERFDALILLMWTLCSVLAAAGLLIGIGRCTEAFTEKTKKLPAAAAAVCAAAACLLTGQGGLSLPSEAAAVLMICVCAAGMLCGSGRAVK